jgi:outer membrane lipoprotein-sorting protein
MKKSLLSLLLMVCGFLAANAQDPMAEEILNNLSRKYKSYKSFKATYTQTLETNAGKKENAQQGEILVRGEKFRLKLPEVEVFSDGKLNWAWVKKSKEVNLTETDPNEEDITPANIYMLHQRGYKFVLMSEHQGANGVVQTIDLEPKDLTKEITKIRLLVDKKTLTINKWIVFERGTNNRSVFEVKSFTPNAPTKDSDFMFNKAAHPDVKLVDLR